jgi:hypothetical protein
VGWGEIALITLLSAWVLVRLGILPPPHAALLIRIRGGQLKIARGQLHAQAREFIAGILREAGIAKGFIAMTPGGSILFSPNIPASTRQRIRNVLLNL